MESGEILLAPKSFSSDTLHYYKTWSDKKCMLCYCYGRGYLEDELKEFEGLKEITIEEILAKFKKNELIDSCIIKCDLNPTTLNLPKINGKFLITSKIGMIRCRIEGKVNLNETIFKEKVTFSNSQFYGEIGFSDSKFCKDTNFIGTRFCKVAAFNDTEFIGAAIFSHVKFYGPAYFSGKSQFYGGADFSQSTFGKLAYFKSDFKRNASFGFSQFKGDADFSSSNFYGVVNFDDSTFDKYANFAGAKFIEAAEKNGITFAGSLFNNQVSFAGSRFGRDISFSNNKTDIFRYARFKEYVDFQGAKFKKLDLGYARFEDDVNFIDAQFISEVDFSYASFDKNIEFSTYKNAKQFDKDCKIILRNTAFHRLNVHWDDIKDHLENSEPSDLNSLVKSYSELGWFDDADNCYLRYKNSLIYVDYLRYFIGFKIVRSLVKNFGSFKDRKCIRFINTNYIINSKIFNFLDYSIKILIHLLSFFFYGHGVKLRWPIFTGFIVILGSAYIYYHGGQVNSFYPDGIKLSSKIFISTTQVGDLTGFCESWSIIERFLGAILLVTSLVVLARKAMR
jgi:hypothetical protein